MTTSVASPAREDDATRLGRAAAGRFRLPGFAAGRGGNSSIGRSAVQAGRFAASTARPVHVRRMLTGSASDVATEQPGVLRPPRWWRELAALDGSTPGPEPTDLPPRGLPRAVRRVPNPETWTPGGLVGGITPREVDVQRPRDVRAIGQLPGQNKLHAAAAAQAIGAQRVGAAHADAGPGTAGEQRRAASQPQHIAPSPPARSSEPPSPRAEAVPPAPPAPPAPTSPAAAVRGAEPPVHSAVPQPPGARTPSGSATTTSPPPTTHAGGQPPTGSATTASQPTAQVDVAPPPQAPDTAQIPTPPPSSPTKASGTDAAQRSIGDPVVHGGPRSHAEPAAHTAPSWLPVSPPEPDPLPRAAWRGAPPSNRFLAAVQRGTFRAEAAHASAVPAVAAARTESSALPRATATAVLAPPSPRTLLADRAPLANAAAKPLRRMVGAAHALEPQLASTTTRLRAPLGAVGVTSDVRRTHVIDAAARADSPAAVQRPGTASGTSAASTAAPSAPTPAPSSSTAAPTSAVPAPPTPSAASAVAANTEQQPPTTTTSSASVAAVRASGTAAPDTVATEPAPTVDAKTAAADAAPEAAREIAAAAIPVPQGLGLSSVRALPTTTRRADTGLAPALSIPHLPAGAAARLPALPTISPTARAGMSGLPTPRHATPPTNGGQQADPTAQQRIGDSRASEAEQPGTAASRRLAAIAMPELLSVRRGFNRVSPSPTSRSNVRNEQGVRAAASVVGAALLGHSSGTGPAGALAAMGYRSATGAAFHRAAAAPTAPPQDLARLGPGNTGASNRLPPTTGFAVAPAAAFSRSGPLLTAPPKHAEASTGASGAALLARTAPSAMGITPAEAESGAEPSDSLVAPLPRALTVAPPRISVRPGETSQVRPGVISRVLPTASASSASASSASRAALAGMSGLGRDDAAFLAAASELLGLPPGGTESPSMPGLGGINVGPETPRATVVRRAPSEQLETRPAVAQVDVHPPGRAAALARASQPERLEALVDLVVERIEQRVIDELERRGRRHSRAVF
jgi:Meckel syndrome type 1 protein